MTTNIRTPQRTVSAMQRFAVSQKNHAEAITISPFLLSLPYRTENRRFSALSCTKTGSTQPKLSAACFVVQSCLADADFVVSSNYCLIGTRHMGAVFFLILIDLPPGGAQSLPQAQAGRDGDRPRVLPLDPDQVAPRGGEIADDEGGFAPAGLSF